MHAQCPEGLCGCLFVRRLLSVWSCGAQLPGQVRWRKCGQPCMRKTHARPGLGLFRVYAGPSLHLYDQLVVHGAAMAWQDGMPQVATGESLAYRILSHIYNKQAASTGCAWDCHSAEGRTKGGIKGSEGRE